MDLEEHLTEEEQLERLRLAEWDHEQSRNWRGLVERHGAFAALHHPYTDLANEQGHYIFLSSSRPEIISIFTPERMLNLEDCDRFTLTIIAEGGSTKFDRRSGQRWLELVSRSPASSLSGITDAAWEKHVIQYLRQNVVTVVKEALQLPDTVETENRIGYTHNGLHDLAAYSQAFLMAKTLGQGVEAVRRLIRPLQEGKWVYER